MHRKSCKNPAFAPAAGEQTLNQADSLPLRLFRFFVFCSAFALSSPVWALQPPLNVGATPGLSRDQIQDGWISLFDGETLFGWKPVSQADWRVENGEIRVSNGEPGLLRTTAQFDDFEMTLEFKADSRTNSGVFLRTQPQSEKCPCRLLRVEHRRSAGPSLSDRFLGSAFQV